jgi:hypothetical protein
MTTVIVNWHAVADAFVWACIGFSLALALEIVVDGRARKRRYVKELEALVRSKR